MSILISRVNLNIDNAGRQVVTLTRVLNMSGKEALPVQEKISALIDYDITELGGDRVYFEGEGEYEINGSLISELLEAIDLSPEWKEDKDLSVDEQTYNVEIF